MNVCWYQQGVPLQLLISERKSSVLNVWITWETVCKVKWLNLYNLAKHNWKTNVWENSNDVIKLYVLLNLVAKHFVIIIEMNVCISTLYTFINAESTLVILQ